MAVGDLLYGESVRPSHHVSFRLCYENGLRWFSDIASSCNLGSPFERHGFSNTKLSAKMAVREIRYLRSSIMLDHSVGEALQELCLSVMENECADKLDKAWALFYSADQIIGVLRLSGSLRRVWNGEEHEVPEEELKRLERARSLLTDAVSLHSIGSDILSRSILRTLALVSGPEIEPVSNAPAGALVLMSLGQFYRQKMIGSLKESPAELSHRVERLLDIFDAFEGDGVDGDGISQQLDQLALVSSQMWKYAALALTPAGDVLVTSIEKDVDCGKMRMKTTWIEPLVSASAYEDILAPLDAIVEESQMQLQGMGVSAVSEHFQKEDAKRTWWDKRHDLDDELQALLERVESQYFPSLHIGMNSGESIFQQGEDEAQLPIGNLTSKFEEAANMKAGHQETIETLRTLTVPLLKERLRSEFGFTDSRFRKMKKQDLIDLYIEERNNATTRSKVKGPSSSSGCLFLLLDENLHRFPFEGMPSLFGKSICRIPSISFVLGALLDEEGGEREVGRIMDPSKASFVLDPERNLMSTRNRIRPVLDTIATENNWNWSEVVGDIPPASFFEDGLGQHDGLFMYFGHGGGQTCFSRKQVQNLVGARDGHAARACRSTVILMGCSSGRLVSVNRKGSHGLDQVPLHYEPEGIALSYLCAGAPCVIGNLWDVTDHDIDRYSTTLLEAFLGKTPDEDLCDGTGVSSTISLASCVSQSRSACKLRYMVGCAPVCYGIPVHVVRPQ